MTALNVRKVSVTVDATGTVVCTPDPVNAIGQHLLIAFSLDTPGYTFPDNGAIVLSAGGVQFPWNSWTAKPTLAGVYDANTSAGDFKYTVNVVGPGGESLSVDPSVKNTGG